MSARITKVGEFKQTFTIYLKQFPQIWWTQRNLYV